MINPVARYREFVDGGLLAVYDSTVGGQLLACNETFARLIGFDSVEAAIGCDLRPMYMEGNRAEFVQRIRDEGRVQNVRGRLRSRRGEIRHVLLTGIGDFDERRELVAVHGYLIDITESVEAQRQSEKMETVGRLAGGVAHDFNNLLTAILGYSELLLGNETLGPAERRDLEEIQRAGQRAASLTQQLLAFSRKQVLMPKDVDLNATVTNLRTMLARLIREDITLTIDLLRQPATIRIDPIQLEQVLLNLVLNARDALPAGGHIRIEVSRVDPMHVQLPPDADKIAAVDYIRLRISDNGTGIAPEAQAHLFEPFFTTKEVGKGTGLGLASVYGIVRQSNGIITVDSEPGRGTTFTMLFPSATDTAVPAAGLVPAPVFEPATETILLVEDEDAVRAILAAALRRHGYTVLEAATPAAASELFEHHADTISLLLSDVIMPGVNGPALAQRLIGRRPGLRILFISGYADAIRPAEIDSPNVGFLGKPFQVSVLLDRVREMLARVSKPHRRSLGAA